MADSKNDDIIDKVRTYFMEDQGFSNKFEKWAEANCDVIELNADEHKLEYTELYKEFCQMFEKGIEDYIVSQGSTTMEFYEKLRKMTEADENSEASFFTQILLATSDYDLFIQMLRYQKEDKLANGRK